MWASVILTVGGSAGFLALVADLGRTLKNRKREKFELDEAINKAPIIKQSLELGNLDVAIKNLLAINTSQAAHIDNQDKRIAHLEQENEQLRHRVDELENGFTNRSSTRRDRISDRIVESTSDDSQQEEYP